MKPVKLSCDGCISIPPRRGYPLWIEGLKLRATSRGILTFSARGLQDVIVLMSEDPHVVGTDNGIESVETSTRSDYEFCFGGNCGTRAMIKKKGTTKYSIRGTKQDLFNHNTTTNNDYHLLLASKNQANPPLKTGAHEWTFRSFWVAFDEDVMAMGIGLYGENEILRWKDSVSITPLSQIGFTTWNTSVVVKDLRLTHVSCPFLFDSHSELSLTQNLLPKASVLDAFADLCLISTSGNSYRVHTSVLVASVPKLQPIIYSLQNKQHSEHHHHRHHEHQLHTENSPLLEFRVPLSDNACKLLIRFLYSEICAPRSFPDQDNRHISQLLNETSLAELTCFQQLYEVEGLEYFLGYGCRSQPDIDLLCDNFLKLLDTEQFADVEFLVASEEHENEILRETKQDEQAQAQTQTQVTLEKETPETNHVDDFHSDDDDDNQSYVESDSKTLLRAHREILAARNPVFYRMFTNGMLETKSKRIRTGITSPQALKALFQYVYSNGKVPAVFENMSVYEAIDVLDISEQYNCKGLQQMAASYIHLLTSPANVADIVQIAAVYSLLDLQEYCTEYIAENLPQVLKLSFDKMLEISPEILWAIYKRDHLASYSDLLIDFIIKWSESREPNEISRFSDYINIAFIHTPVSQNSKKLEWFQKLTFLKDLLNYSQPNGSIENIFELSYPYKDITGSWLESSGGNLFDEHNFLENEFSVSVFLKRLPKGRGKLTYLHLISGEEAKGLFNYLGSQLEGPLAGMWVNPCLTRQVSIVLSDSSNMRVSNIVNRLHHNQRSFIFVNASNKAWIEIDIGENREFACFSYTLQHDGSNCQFLRSWALYGSTDNKTWIMVDKVIDSIALRTEYQRATFSTMWPTCELYFRFWRLTWLDSEAFQRHIGYREPSASVPRLTLGSLEFHGKLFERSAD